MKTLSDEFKTLLPWLVLQFVIFWKCKVHDQNFVNWRNQCYISDQHSKIMSLNMAKITTVAVFGIFGQSWKVFWLCKNQEFPFESFPADGKPSFSNLIGKEKQDVTEKREMIIGIYQNEYHLLSFLGNHVTDAKIKMDHFFSTCQPQLEKHCCSPFS